MVISQIFIRIWVILVFQLLEILVFVSWIGKIAPDSVSNEDQKGNTNNTKDYVNSDLSWNKTKITIHFCISERYLSTGLLFKFYKFDVFII